MINQNNSTDLGETKDISTSEPDTKNIFNNLCIYVEIYNNNINQSDVLDDILKLHGANVLILNS